MLYVLVPGRLEIWVGHDVLKVKQVKALLAFNLISTIHANQKQQLKYEGVSISR